MFELTGTWALFALGVVATVVGIVANLFGIGTAIRSLFGRSNDAGAMPQPIYAQARSSPRGLGQATLVTGGILAAVVAARDAPVDPSQIDASLPGLPDLPAPAIDPSDLDPTDWLP